MPNKELHTFHIPVMGTSFSIDTPIKVAQYGIDSVIQIMDDFLCENMRKFYAEKYALPYEPINDREDDFRARRITAYLDLLDVVIKKQIAKIKTSEFSLGSDLTKYFEMLPDTSSLKQVFIKMNQTTDLLEKSKLQDYLRTNVKPGAIDVNIMTVVDRDNFDNEGKPLPEEYSDALAALRGFAKSTVEASVVLSAGFNRRLNTYMENFEEFFPDQNGYLKKKIVIKVSDYRSSLIQGKLFAKKGLWVSEYRIESGLNCGGHAFASEGYLMGPILEEFKRNKVELSEMLFTLCNEALAKKNKFVFITKPDSRITVQGGIGTAKENNFLFDYYKVDGTGWATPFLLVPEATIVDDVTLDLLVKAGKDDAYLSPLSPLGVPFNAVRNTKSDLFRQERLAENKLGNPCRKGHLCFNHEFEGKSLCAASTAYQKKKVEQLNSLHLLKEEYDRFFRKIVEKACLCEDLAAGAYLKYKIPIKTVLNPVICPGPNIAYFSKIVSLAEMIGHIYGRLNLLNSEYRPHMFITELKMYIDYLKNEIINSLPKVNEKQIKYFINFKNNLFDGIEYYKNLLPKFIEETIKYKENMDQELTSLKLELENIVQTYKDVIFLQPKLLS